MQRKKKRKLKKPLGDCYRIAGSFVLHHHEGTLVHGTVWSILLKRFINHAWVELPAGTEISDDYGESITLDAPAVYDGTLKKEHMLLPKELYMRSTRAKVECRYNDEQTALNMMRNNHWGPWHETEIPD